MTLHELKIGQKACIEKLGGNGALRQHFLDMGIIPGAEITFVKYAPLGDPMEFQLHGYELTLRVADAEKIIVSEIESNSALGTHLTYNDPQFLEGRQPAMRPGTGGRRLSIFRLSWRILRRTSQFCGKIFIRRSI